MYIPEKKIVKVLAKQIHFWPDCKMIKLQKAVGSFCKAPAQRTSQHSPSEVFTQLILKMQVHKIPGPECLHQLQS